MLLTELEWRDLSPVGRALRAYEGKGLWLHFSFINKIGFNPSATRRHDDPPGVYFFPLDWLASNAEKRETFGTSTTSHVHRYYWSTLPHWFVCDIKLPPHGRDGLVLSKVTLDDLDDWATRFGVSDLIAAWRSGADEAKHLVPFWAADKPGAVLYAAMKRKSGRGTPWMSMLRGIRYLYDDVAAISQKEPLQLMVFDPSMFRVLDSGSQRQVHGATQISDFETFWRQGLNDVVQAVARAFGGQFTWKPAERTDKPRPRAIFAVGDRSFELRVTERMGVSLRLEYAYGRAKGSLSIESEDLLALSRDDLIARIKSMVDGIATRKSDLMFKPVVREGAFRELLAKKVASGQDFTWKTEIDNEAGRMEVHGTARHEADGFPFSVSVYGSVFEDQFTSGVISRCKSINVMHASVYGDQYGPENVGDALDDLAAELPKNLVGFVRPHDPSLEQTAYNREPRMADERQFKAFRGWAVANSGVVLDGRVPSVFAEDLAAFRDYPDQGLLLSDIRRALMFRKY